MHVRTLEYVEYPPSGARWTSTKVREPARDEIEAAIRRLDRHRFPAVILWTTDVEADQVLDGSTDAFEVMGGNGVYWVAATFDRYFQRRLDYPALGDQQLTVWTSDQGFADAARHICRDIAAVLRAAFFFAEEGGFDPALQWETRAADR